MIFSKKAQTVNVEILSAKERLAELNRQLEVKQNELKEKETSLGEALGAMAQKENDDTKDRVARAKKALTLSRDTIGDLTVMIQSLEKRIGDLTHEMLVAQHRELPDAIKKTADEFVKKLRETLKLAEALEAVYPALKDSRQAFIGAIDQYNAVCRGLGILNTLEIPDIRFNMPDLPFLFQSLLSYRNEEEARKAGRAANPDIEERLQAVREKMGKGYEFVPFARGGTSIFRQPDTD
jgi:DNA repair exonuclease SbcCD ATPase subunit